MTNWLLSELNLQSPVFWLLLSFVTTIVLAVVFRRSRPSWAIWLWVGQWIMIPYFGLVLGGLSPRLMGLSNLNWVTTFGLGSGLFFVILILLVTVRLATEFTDKLPPDKNGIASENPSHSADSVQPTTSVWQAAMLVILLSGAEEFHWVFLRGALWELLLKAPNSPELPGYWAIWIAAGLVLLETALRKPSAEQWLVHITVLATTSILFLYTRNFWLCWILHSAAVLILTTNGRTQFLSTGRINGTIR